MKISRPSANSASSLNSSPGIEPDNRTAASSASPAQNVPSDQVRLSRMIGSLISALSGSPAQMAEQLAKISELSAEVSSGQYRVDAYLVSDSIIRHYLRFGRTGHLALSS